MSNEALFANACFAAFLLQKQTPLWLTPTRARIQIQDELDSKWGRNSDHAELAQTATAFLRAIYLIISLTWLAFFVQSL